MRPPPVNRACSTMGAVGGLVPRLRCTLYRSRLFVPVQLELSTLSCTVEQIKVYQVLVWNTRLARERLEVADHIWFKTDRNCLLDSLGVWVASRVGKIIFFSHFFFSQYGFCSFVPARRAEMIRIEEPSWRKQ
jgi:hypothetical protein